jgi:hypothetical protein
MFPNMSRRGKSKGVPIWPLLLLAAAAAAAGYFFLAGDASKASLRTVEELPVELYYKDANSLRGNTYKIDAEIDSSLGISPGKGRLFSVILKNGAKEGIQTILPVLVPVKLGSLTIQKGQHYLMKVKVVEGGLLAVEDARKP